MSTTTDERILVQVTKTNRFGREVYKPHNALARMVVDLSAAREELTDRSIGVLKHYGYIVEVVSETEIL